MRRQTVLSLIKSLMLYAAVVVFCHSKFPVMGRFLFRAQDRNMTNGDFAFFTYWALQDFITDTPWFLYKIDSRDLRRRLRAFYVVKQVREYFSPSCRLYVEINMDIVQVVFVLC